MIALCKESWNPDLAAKALIERWMNRDRIPVIGPSPNLKL